MPRAATAPITSSSNRPEVRFRARCRHAHTNCGFTQPIDRHRYRSMAGRPAAGRGTPGRRPRSLSCRGSQSATGSAWRGGEVIRRGPKADHFHADRRPRAVDPLTAFAAYQKSPLTLAILGVVIGYYLLYYAGVLNRSRALQAPT